VIGNGYGTIDLPLQFAPRLVVNQWNDPATEILLASSRSRARRPPRRLKS
jgi:hypothetical protein